MQMIKMRINFRVPHQQIVEVEVGRVDKGGGFNESLETIERHQLKVSDNEE